jgi:hypothetical protein
VAREAIVVDANTVVRKKTPVRTVFLLVTITALLAALPALAVAVTTTVVPASLSGPLRVASVSASTVSTPYAAVEIVATLAGESIAPMRVILQWAAYFGTIESGAVEMNSIRGRDYYAALPILPSGTEVWYVVGVIAGTRQPALSESQTVTIGTVPRGGASGLAISDLSHFPSNPSPRTAVTISATVTSRSPVTEVDVAYMAFCPDRAMTPPIDPPMYTIAPSRYQIEIMTPDPCSSSPTAILLYRVFAVDASGNTAVSDAMRVAMG